MPRKSSNHVYWCVLHFSQTSDFMAVSRINLLLMATALVFVSQESSAQTKVAPDGITFRQPSLVSFGGASRNEPMLFPKDERLSFPDDEGTIEFWFNLNENVDLRERLVCLLSSGQTVIRSGTKSWKTPDKRSSVPPDALVDEFFETRLAIYLDRTNTNDVLPLLCVQTGDQVYRFNIKERLEAQQYIDQDLTYIAIVFRGGKVAVHVNGSASSIIRDIKLGPIGGRTYLGGIPPEAKGIIRLEDDQQLLRIEKDVAGFSGNLGGVRIWGKAIDEGNSNLFRWKNEQPPAVWQYEQSHIERSIAFPPREDAAVPNYEDIVAYSRFGTFAGQRRSELVAVDSLTGNWVTSQSEPSVADEVGVGLPEFGPICLVDNQPIVTIRGEGSDSSYHLFIDGLFTGYLSKAINGNLHFVDFAGHEFAIERDQPDSLVIRGGQHLLPLKIDDGDLRLERYDARTKGPRQNGNNEFTLANRQKEPFYRAVDLFREDPRRDKDMKGTRELFVKPGNSDWHLEDSNLIVPYCFHVDDNPKSTATWKSLVTTSQQQYVQSQTTRFGISGGGPMFSAGINGEWMNSSDVQTSSTAMTVTAKSIAKNRTLSIDPFFIQLHPDFQHDVTELIGKNDESFDRFIQQWGTHYSHGSTYGGMLWYTQTLDESEITRGVSMGLDVNAFVQAGSSGGPNFKAEGGQKYETSEREYEKWGKDNVNVSMYGVSPTVAVDPKFIQSAVTNDSMKSIAHDLRPLHELLSPIYFDDPAIYFDVRAQLHSALQRCAVSVPRPNNRPFWDYSQAKDKIVPRSFLHLRLKRWKHNAGDETVGDTPQFFGKITALPALLRDTVTATGTETKFETFVGEQVDESGTFSPYPYLVPVPFYQTNFTDNNNTKSVKTVFLNADSYKDLTGAYELWDEGDISSDGAISIIEKEDYKKRHPEFVAHFHTKYLLPTDALTRLNQDGKLCLKIDIDWTEYDYASANDSFSFVPNPEATLLPEFGDLGPDSDIYGWTEAKPATFWVDAVNKNTGEFAEFEFEWWFEPYTTRYDPLESIETDKPFRNLFDQLKNQTKVAARKARPNSGKIVPTYIDAAFLATSQDGENAAKLFLFGKGSDTYVEMSVDLRESKVTWAADAHGNYQEVLVTNAPVIFPQRFVERPLHDFKIGSGGETPAEVLRFVSRGIDAASALSQRYPYEGYIFSGSECFHWKFNNRDSKTTWTGPLSIAQSFSLPAPFSSSLDAVWPSSNNISALNFKSGSQAIQRRQKDDVYVDWYQTQRDGPQLKYLPYDVQDSKEPILHIRDRGQRTATAAFLFGGRLSTKIDVVGDRLVVWPPGEGKDIDLSHIGFVKPELAHHYPFDEAEASTAMDIAGANNGTYNAWAQPFANPSPVSMSSATFPFSHPRSVHRIQNVSVTSEVEGVQFEVDGNGIVKVSGANPPGNITYTVSAKLEEVSEPVTELLLEVLQSSTAGNRVGRAANGNFCLTELTAALDGTPVEFVSARSNFSQSSSWPVESIIDGKVDEKNGWSIYPHVGERCAATLRLKEPLDIKKGQVLTLEMPQNHYSGHHSMASFRLSFYSGDGGGFVTLNRPLTIGDESNTVEMWVKLPRPESYKTRGGGMLFGNNFELAHERYCLQILPNGHPTLMWNETFVEGSTDLRDSHWHLLTFVRDKKQNRFSIYVDGQQDGKLAVPFGGTDIKFRSQHKIGFCDSKFPSADTLFNGLIDELKVFSRALTDEEIRTHFTSTQETLGRN